jgi:high-affinity iron transporter
LAAALVAAAASPVGAQAAGSAAQPPWKAAAELRMHLAEAERALILGEAPAAADSVARADSSARRLAELLPGDRVADSFRDVESAVESGSAVRLASARASLNSAILGGSYRTLLAALRSRDPDEARRWLLVREFRPPTRFSRPGADATLAIESLAEGRATTAQAVAAVRADYLDTYQARLRTALAGVDEAGKRGFDFRLVSESALARGYFGILRESYRRQRGDTEARRAAGAFDALVAAALAGESAGIAQARNTVVQALEGFRAAPLADDEKLRRAGQFLRFLALVPVEYGRGVADGRVTLAFEIQEAVTFHDGAAQALADLESELVKLDPAAVRRLDELVGTLGSTLAAATRGERVAPEQVIDEQASTALELAEATFPDRWKEGQAAADFDVIRTSLDRVVNAVRAGEYSRAEQARLEAYAFFEFGPEQRLRGLAPNLFIRTEGLFWYGADGHPGLAQLIHRKSQGSSVAATREALDEALAESEAAVGSGPTSATAVVVNTAIIVFREGLEAVLILAVLTAGLIGAKRRFRRPLLLGAGAALVASAVTFVVAQTILASLIRYGERVEAVVSILAVAVLLLILNWFFHRVYWSDHLAGLHGRKKQMLRGAGISAAAAQFAGLAMLGFTAVYREGFETALFLQALVLDAGVLTVSVGVAAGGLAVAGVGVLTIALQHRLPHKRMLELTGLLILGVLVIMAGKTVQVCQVVGWLPVHPIGEIQLPYWSGLWFGVFPTWEGFAAQVGAGAFVVGSYLGAEWLRGRRLRARIEQLDARRPHSVQPSHEVATEPVGVGRR